VLLLNCVARQPRRRLGCARPLRISTILHPDSKCLPLFRTAPRAGRAPEVIRIPRL
jgi:hypothetical protein